MLDTLRTPFLFIAAFCMLLVVFAEIGSSFYINGVSDTATVSQYTDLAAPGLGISYMAFLDGIILFTVALIISPLIISDRLHGKIQGIATFLFSLSILISAIAMVFVALALIMLMITLLLSIPFGTIAYMIMYASFDTNSATITLSALMTLKIAFVIFLVLAHQRFLQNKGLILLILTSFIATIVLSFLHGMVPDFLVSITDGVGAIIITIFAIIWSIVYLIGSIPAVIKAFRVDKLVS